MVSIILSACSLSAPSKQSVCWQLSLWKTQSSLLETEGPGTDKYRWANMPENNTTSSSSAVSWVMNTSPDSSAMAPLFSSEADATDSPYFVVVVVTVENYTGFSNTILWSFSRNRQWNGVSREGRVLFSSITAEIFKHLVLEPQRCLTDSPHTCWRVELLVSCIYMWQNVLFSSHTVHSLGLTLHMCRLLIYRYSLSHSEQFRQREKWICCRRVSTCTWQPVLATYPESCWSTRYSARFWEGGGGTEQKQKIHIVQYCPAVPNK